jgi:murein DD-endopeptidase MepM/ murein hydrolase activator NlpD
MFPTAVRTRLQGFTLAAAILFATLVASYGAAVAQNPIRFTPATLTNGAPCLITVVLHDEASGVTGSWQGHPVAFFPSSDRRTWFALVGIDVEATPSNYPLTIDATLNGRYQTLHQDVSVGEAPYEKVPLSVPDKFVEPDAAALKKIAADKIVKDKAFANSAPKPQWTGDFLPPLHLAPQSDSFGNQRIFNGKLASVHRGLDYRAKPSTPVAAINSGRVVLARPLYYEGGCVVIDHGLGLMSVYMHLSKIEVAVGKRVRRGQIIALSGATGRATGPHLHLGVRWEGSYLDPAKLFEITMPRPDSIVEPHLGPVKKNKNGPAAIH